MRNRPVSASLIILLVPGLSWVLPACDTNPLGTIEATGHVPFVSSPSVTPDSVYVDALTPVAGSYIIPVVIAARVEHPDGPGSINQVTASFVRPGEIDPITQILLSDDGNAPDAAAGDGFYTGSAQLSLYRPQAGTWRVQIAAVDINGLRSNTADIRLRLTIKNSPPVLGVPSVRFSKILGSSFVRYSFTLAASDSNGLETISSVIYHARNVTDTSAHQLFDDGLLAHGDGIPGDGIFSGIDLLTPTISPDSVSFVFTAVDDHGASASVTYNVSTNAPPSIVSLNVPSTITRPVSGSIPVLFSIAVADPNGLGDIDSVYFRNFSSLNPNNVFTMYDDGNVAAHGDTVANDGTYSIVVQISSTNTPGTKEFHFYVVDKSGASATAVRYIVIN